MSNIEDNAEENEKLKILIPENFFPLVENYGRELRIYTVFEKYLEENVKKIHERLIKFLRFTTLSTEERQKCRQIINEILYKIGAAVYHYYQFRQLYVEMESLVHNSKDSLPECDMVHFDVPRLGYEVESLLYQLKSTLDLLVKILPIIFKIKVSFSRFGKKGETVVRALENNLKKESPNRVKIGAKNIIELIKQSHAEEPNESKNVSWLRLMIELRDEFTHKAKSNIFFITQKDESGKVTILPPKITRQQTYVEGLEILIYNSLRFIEDFLMHSIGCVLNPDQKIMIVRQRKFNKDWVWCNEYDWILSGGDIPEPLLRAVKVSMRLPENTEVKKVIDDNYIVGS